jgi:beta-ureidopropionase / N-carbamoyl-L-amino-acid hydrolase
MDRREFLGVAGATAAAPFVPLGWRRQPAPSLRANGTRLNAQLAQFDAIGRTAGGINRVAYSDADLAGRAFAQGIFRDAGLAVRVDAAGNLVATLPGTDPSLPPIVIGSHVDSVTDGGNYDGPVGSFAAIEVARSLREQGRRLRHPLDVVVWQNEEGGTIGSKLVIGALTAADLDRRARSGFTLREGLARVGGDVTKLADVVRRPGSIAAYVELHIEQGGILERQNRQIGVVEGIVGLRWLEVTVTGMANHAGATPMDQRQDALLAAARFTVAVNEIIRAEPGRQVATVGRIEAKPNTSNVIAGSVTLTVDLRDLDGAKLARFADRIERAGAEIGQASGTTFAFTKLVDSAPAPATPALMAQVEAAAGALGASTLRMPSGAGHDAQELARIGPMAMIFVPSVGGISHAPKEFSRPEDIARGLDVLLNTIVAIDQQR